jgi:hypothetical protein
MLRKNWKYSRTWTCSDNNNFGGKYIWISIFVPNFTNKNFIASLQTAAPYRRTSPRVQVAVFLELLKFTICIIQWRLDNKVLYYSYEVQMPITAVNRNNFTSKFQQFYAILDPVHVFRLKIRFSQKKQNPQLWCVWRMQRLTQLSVPTNTPLEKSHWNAKKLSKRINSTKSPASSAGKVIEPRLMSKVVRVREVVCA